MSPCVGEIVYVDDIDVAYGTFVRGGRATVGRVWHEGSVAWIQVVEVPGASWPWDGDGGLGARQEVLRSDEAAGDLMVHMNDGRICRWGGDDEDGGQ